MRYNVKLQLTALHAGGHVPIEGYLIQGGTDTEQNAKQLMELVFEKWDRLENLELVTRTVDANGKPRLAAIRLNSTVLANSIPMMFIQESEYAGSGFWA